ncbi:MAG: DUF4389 domain-containing protein [Acidobacteria bacterium]|nr:MAG: DUF4389 domain-containing protein [Acidobacteriota bacterium]
MPETPGGSYPVQIDVDPQRAGRNRLTVGFRVILAFPHLILVGAPGFGLGLYNETRSPDGSAGHSGSLGSNGVLGIVAVVAAIISWFAIVFTGRQPRGLWDLTRFYMRWRANAVAYTALLRDEYPPFGVGPYPVTYDVQYPERRDRLTVGLRLILAIPHVVVLVFLDIAWFVTAVVAWLAILFTGEYPDGLYRFGIGVMRWTLRVETYVLLMRDEYPPFSLQR